MAKTKAFQYVFIAIVAFLGLGNLWHAAFVPPSDRRINVAKAPKIPPAAIAAALLCSPAPPAFADPIDDAAKAFADASYPIVEKLNWADTPEITSWLNTANKDWDVPRVAKFFDAILETGLSMDPKLVRAAVQAHDTALGDAMQRPGFVCPRADLEDVTMALAHALSSSKNQYIMNVYDSFAALQGTTLANNFLTQLNESNRVDVSESYKAFLDLAQVVKTR